MFCIYLIGSQIGFKVGFFFELDMSYTAPKLTEYITTAFSDKMGLCRASCPSTGVVIFILPDTVPALPQITPRQWESTKVHPKKR